MQPLMRLQALPMCARAKISQLRIKVQLRSRNRKAKLNKRRSLKNRASLRSRKRAYHLHLRFSLRPRVAASRFSRCARLFAVIGTDWAI